MLRCIDVAADVGLLQSSLLHQAVTVAWLLLLQVARLMEALQYGSGLDYHGHQQPQVHGQAQLNGSPPSPCAPDTGTLQAAPSSQHPVLAA